MTTEEFVSTELSAQLRSGVLGRFGTAKSDAVDQQSTAYRPRRAQVPEHGGDRIAAPLAWVAIALSIGLGWASVRPHPEVGAGWLWWCAAAAVALTTSVTGPALLEIHDDQLDRILTVEALGLALWLAGSGSGWGRGGETRHAVVAGVLVALAAMVAIVGTRLVYRLRWVWVLVLGGFVPILQSWPVGCLLLAAALVWSRRRLRTRQRVSIWVPTPAWSRLLLVVAGAVAVALVGGVRG